MKYGHLAKDCYQNTKIVRKKLHYFVATSDGHVVRGDFSSQGCLFFPNYQTTKIWKSNRKKNRIMLFL